MYWKKEIINSDNNTYIKYEYFTLVKTPHPAGTFYNPITQTHNHSIIYELKIAHQIMNSEKEFLIWYAANKNI